mgnify:CR=1 FL=1
MAFLVFATGGKFGARQTVAFFFPDFRLMDSMAVLIQVRDAQKRFADQLVLDDAELSLVDDVKVGFIGRNGAGKSTLLKVLLGEEDLEKGEVVHHPSLRIGYLRQHDPFQPGESALDFLMRDSGEPDWRCGEVAGQFELKGAYLEGPVKSLSGGWQTRVKLAALLLKDPNLLMLDEPTNHLDVVAIEWLEGWLPAMDSWQGWALLITVLVLGNEALLLGLKL